MGRDLPAARILSIEAAPLLREPGEKLRKSRGASQGPERDFRREWLGGITMTGELVSIIVPSFEFGRFLPDTLDSILTQDYRPLQVIVSDGGSRDDTVTILHDYSARYPELEWMSEPDNGPADAINRGLSRAHGAYIGVQNADDLYYPGAIDEAVHQLKENPAASFVYGDVDFMDIEGVTRRTRCFPDFSWSAFFAWSCTVAQSSILFRRSAMKAVGLWNADYYSCDLDYWLRLSLHAPPVHLPRVLSGWRLHDQQRTRPDQMLRICEDYRRMIEDNPDLRSAGIQRLAWASVHLLYARHLRVGQPWRRFAHLLLGLAAHPGALRHTPWQRHARAIPGSKVLRRLKRRVNERAALRR